MSPRHFGLRLYRATSLCLSAGAADNDKAATDSGLARTEAKDLKTQSEANHKARGKIAEANEVLNKADCKTALEGSARRACEKSAKAAAKWATAPSVAPGEPRGLLAGSTRGDGVNPSQTI